MKPLSVWHRVYLGFLIARGIPTKMAIEMAESVEETVEDPAVVADRHILEDFGGQM